MNYMGDYPTSAVVRIPWDSFAGATGAPSATSNFANTDILIYKNGSTTQRSSAAGITVSTSFDSLVGLQLVEIDTSDNTDAGFYAAGNDYIVAVSDVTIDSQTMRFWLGSFSIERSGGALAVVKARLPAALVSGRMDSSVGAMATDVVNANALASDAVSEIWNGNPNLVRTNTAQGGTANTITLDAGASSTNGLYDPSLIQITGGTGVGQARLIIDYNGTTKVAAVDKDWRTNPDATSVFRILAAPNLASLNEGLAQAGAATTITLNALASATDNIYNGQCVWIRTGTGQDQLRLITGYVGSTKVATIDAAWSTNPDTTSGYMLIPQGRSLVAAMNANVLTATAIATGAFTAAKFAAGAFDAVWTVTARLLTAGTNIVLPSNALSSITAWTVALTGNITGNLSGSVGSVTGLTASNLDATVSSRLASASYTTPPTVAQNATELLDQAAGVETGLTVRQALRLAASVLFGKASGLDTTTAVYRDFGDTKNRISATVTADGNRTAVTRDAT